MQETLVQFMGWEICWRRDRLPTPLFLGFPGGSDGKESACNVGDLDSIPWLGRSPGEGKSCPFQYAVWRIPCIVHGVAKSRIQLSDFHFLFFQISSWIQFHLFLDSVQLKLCMDMNIAWSKWLQPLSWGKLDWNGWCVFSMGHMLSATVCHVTPGTFSPLPICHSFSWVQMF